MSLTTWIQGARPKTLPLAIAPVIAGAASVCGTCSTSPAWYIAVTLLCLGVALFLQIAANFANDYSDGVRGADQARSASETASGKPQRITASGQASPKQVLVAAGINAALACVCGLAITVLTGHWWFILVGLACLAAGWFYVGGKHPYGYSGFGEISVFGFFGLVATCGTAYALSDAIPALTVWAGVSLGLVAVAVLSINNLRDLDDDMVCGKRTWMVRLGRRFGTALTAGMLIAASLMLVMTTIGHTHGLLRRAWLIAPCSALTALACLMSIGTIAAISTRRYRIALPLCTLTSLIIALGFAFAYSL